MDKIVRMKELEKWKEKCDLKVFDEHLDRLEGWIYNEKKISHQSGRFFL